MIRVLDKRSAHQASASMLHAPGYYLKEAKERHFQILVAYKTRGVLIS